MGNAEFVITAIGIAIASVVAGLLIFWVVRHRNAKR